jgi:hypothetical protein
MELVRTGICLLAAAGGLYAAGAAENAARWRALFAAEVKPALTLPQESVAWYASQLAGVAFSGREFVAVVDRNENVQALVLLLRDQAGSFHLIGAAPVSTGLPGRFDYFETPLGAFAHSTEHRDYRALGTKNENGIRGYGRRGMRVFDLGWIPAKKGWGDGAVMDIRMQMHATDPGHLEMHLGTRRSKGCIRIHSTLNEFFDKYGILDAGYVREAAAGERAYVLRKDWAPAEEAGQWIVVVDSGLSQRPAWSPAPFSQRK